MAITERYAGTVASTRDRPLRVAAPLTPRAGVELRSMQACDFHREQVVAGGYAGAALMHHLCRRQRIEARGEFPFQLGGRFEAAIGREVVFEETVRRAGNMSADRIQRFDLPAETVRAACIDEADARLPELGQDEARIHSVIVRGAAECAGLDCRELRSYR